MVIRGRTRGNGRQLANYLLTQGENERVQVFDIRGTSQPNDLNKSLIEMSLTAELTKSDKGLYHAQINPAYGEDKQMSRKDWLRAAAILETELKLADQKRVMVLHEKHGRIHAHVVWERYDHERGRMISDSYSRLAQDRARKTMEKELEHSPTPARNKRQPDIKKDLTELWRTTRDGAAFIRGSKAKGYTIAKSNSRRPYMIIDETGRSHDLVRHLEKVKTKDVKERLGKEKLPTDKEAIRSIRAWQSEKSLTWMQEQFADRIEKFKASQEAREEQKLLFKEKMSMVKNNSLSIANEQADEKITRSQTEMNAMLRHVRSDSPEAKQEQQIETKRDKILRELNEQWHEQLNRKSKDRGMEI